MPDTSRINSDTVIKGGYFNAASRVAKPIMTSGQWGTASTASIGFDPKQDRPVSVAGTASTRRK